MNDRGGCWFTFWRAPPPPPSLAKVFVAVLSSASDMIRRVFGLKFAAVVVRTGGGRGNGSRKTAVATNGASLPPPPAPLIPLLAFAEGEFEALMLSRPSPRLSLMPVEGKESSGASDEKDDAAAVTGMTAAVSIIAAGVAVVDTKGVADVVCMGAWCGKSSL